MLIKPDLAPFVPYRVTGLERQHQWEVPMNVLRLNLLDAIDLGRFRSDGGGEQVASPEDEAILRIIENSGKAPAVATPEHGPPAASASADVTWLRRTEYLSSESKNKPAFGAKAAPLTTDALTSKAHTRRASTSTPLTTKNDVLRAIETSFAYRPGDHQLTHPTAGAHVHPVAIYPILPTTLNPASYAQCAFDADPNVPAVDGVPIAAQGDRAALMKAMNSSEDANDTFVWYYLPAAEGAESAEKHDDKDERFVYTRDYDVQRVERVGVGATASSSTASLTHFVLGVPKATSIGGDFSAMYAPITSGFHLRKRRAPSDHSKNRHSLKVTRHQRLE